jgi:type IV fimbrial biogenesis protein FimT
MRKDAPGFTLLECMTTLAIAAVLCSLALPGFGELLRRQRSATSVHLVSAQLAQARNTAIMRGQPVTLCPSSGDGRCRADADWSDGWLMYADPLRQSQPAKEADILRDSRSPLPAQVSVRSSSARTRVRFQADGRSAGNNLTLWVCSEDLLLGEIIVNNVGRARSRVPAAGSRCPGADATP